MQITHEEARRLIQFNADQALRPQDKNILQIHLNECGDCRAFAEGIEELESILSPVMKLQWNLQPAPLSLDVLLKSKSSNWQMSFLLVTRTALISFVFVAFVFSAWQFTHSSTQISTPMPLSVLPIPTPSGQSTSTKSGLASCEEVVYQVQENDTLQRIADHFSVPKDQIMTINHLSLETVRTHMELMIPICRSTPTGTIYPTTLTITFTPFMGPTTSTPGS